MVAMAAADLGHVSLAYQDSRHKFAEAVEGDDSLLTSQPSRCLGCLSSVSIRPAQKQTEASKVYQKKKKRTRGLIRE
jgi:hypothetical protein